MFGDHSNVSVDVDEKENLTARFWCECPHCTVDDIEESFSLLTPMIVEGPFESRYQCDDGTHYYVNYMDEPIVQIEKSDAEQKGTLFECPECGFNVLVVGTEEIYDITPTDCQDSDSTEGST